jgi:hypothetical protein
VVEREISVSGGKSRDANPILGRKFLRCSTTSHLLSLYLCTTIVMQTRSSKSVSSGEEQSSRGKSGSRQYAVWTKREEAALVEFLLSKKSEKSDEATMFKSHIFEEAARVLKSLHQKGAEKNAKSCKNKWSQVGISFVRVLPGL